MLIVDELQHYGTPRHSGRYPWGSGKNPYQRSKSFMGMVHDMHNKGMSDVEIAESLGMTVGELRSRKTISRNQILKEEAAEAQRLRAKGYSYAAIAERMGKSGESAIRSLLKQAEADKNQALFSTVEILKKQVEEKGYIDVGLGVESQLGISRTKLKAALEMLEDEGYLVSYTNVRQIGTGKDTSLMVLSSPGTTPKDVYAHKDEIATVTSFSEDGGKTYGSLGLTLPIKSVDSSRIMVRYAEDGGLDKDGVIELRRGIEELSLGNNRYAQVRIGVDGKYYLKGMAIYSDDMPDGVDIIFNTNKHTGTPKESVFKEMEKDPDNPFGASVRDMKYIGSDGNEHISYLYPVNAEGDWETWTKKLSAQFLSKQKPELARKQLDLSFDQIKEEYDEIMSLTNPVVRADRLIKFADQCDSDAVHLKSAALPRQTSSVLLPFTSIKETEVYAPNYIDGEKVVLIRYPHGGIFEIPELVVNNRNPDAKRLIGNAKDAIGINPKVAGILSGADFDGDTVMVIPNNEGDIRTRAHANSELKKLMEFDPKSAYPYYEGMRVMKKGPQTQAEMGKISNLITDMTIKMADSDEIARAVKHSMVVIDAAKHKLDYERSYEEQGIAALKKKYQTGGSSTLLSRAKSPLYVPERKEGYYIDSQTGEKIFTETGAMRYTKPTKTGKTRLVPKTTKSTKMYEAKDARELSSGSLMEDVYADYANKLKNLANVARKNSKETPSLEYRPSARETYAAEVASLKVKLNESLKQRPLERQAQIAANAVVKAKKASNPDLKDDKKALKKLGSQALAAARTRVGKKASSIRITDKEWEAIQAGAVRTNFLKNLLTYADPDRVRELALPSSVTSMTPAKEARIKAMYANGYTQAQIASMMGVSTSTVSRIV